MVQRGSITFWLAEDLEKVWLYAGEKQRGSQFDYSDKAIEIMLTIKEVFHLTNRGVEGFVRSLFEIMDIHLPVPDHTTLSKRGKRLKVKLPRKTGESLNLVLDSTGLKIYGEGEWKVRKHGYSKHRTWRKLHLGANPENGEIQAVVLTENSVSDDAVVKDMLKQIEETLLACAADGAYDQRKVYEALNLHSPEVDILICRARMHASGSMATRKQIVSSETRICGAFASMDGNHGRQIRAITFVLWRKPSCSV